MAQATRVSPKELRDDFEAVFDELRAQGDLVWVEAGEQRFLLVNEPELVSEALVQRSSELVKPRLQTIDTGPARPEPPPTADIGALRRAVTQSLAGRDDPAAEAARAAAAAETATWHDGAEVELMPMLRRISIATAASGAFGRSLDEQATRKLDGVMRWMDAAPRVLPESRFSRHSLRAREMREHLRSVAEQLVSRDVEELAPGVAGELLLGAVGPVAQTGAWLLYRFATEPDEAQRLRAEWPATERTEAFVREVTRLHPTNPRITRAAVADITLGGEPVPRDTRVVLNVNAISRDPRFYDAPDALLPDRWLGGRPHKFAYLSFGVGERRCIGESFALAALTALLPALAAGWAFRFDELRETAKGRRQLAEGTRVTVSVC